MPKTTCLKVPKKSGEQAIRLLRELKLHDSSLRVKQTGDFLCIPLKSEPKTSTLKKIESTLSEYELYSQNFSEQPKRHLAPQDFLTNKLPPDLLAVIPRAIDFVGEIAIVEITPKLVEYKTAIGQAILNAHKPTKTVLAKSGAVEGVFRLRDFEVIAGKKQTATVYKEYGCLYHVDVAKAYFSPRLSSEHNRVANATNDGETVVDLFAGVGPFAVPIAKMHKNVRVYGVDVNPDAVELLKRNIAVNRVEKQVIPILEDARQVVKERLFGKADRVIMNLPETALDFVDVACQTLKPEGGVVHFYDFVRGSDPQKTASVRLTNAVKKSKRRLSEVLLAKTVREVAPYTWQVVVDAKIQ